MVEKPGAEIHPRRSIGDRLFRIFLIVIFVAMVVELVLLVRQNRELKNRISEMLVATGQQRVVAALKDGEIVDPLVLPAVGGELTEVIYGNPELDTLLLIFSPDCPACQANIENWLLMERGHDPSCTRLFYISTADEEGTRSFVEEHGIFGPVLMANQDDLAGYKVTHIPMTIVVGPDGVIKRVWVGVMPEGAADEYINRCGV